MGQCLGGSPPQSTMNITLSSMLEDRQDIKLQSTLLCNEEKRNTSATHFAPGILDATSPEATAARADQLHSAAHPLLVRRILIRILSTQRICSSIKSTLITFHLHSLLALTVPQQVSDSKKCSHSYISKFNTNTNTIV